MFNEFADDGFYSQMLYASKVFDGFIDTNPLFFIHVARLFVVGPFFLIYSQKLPVFFEAIFYLLYLVPIINSHVFKKIGPARIFFILIPIFLSYRSALGMCAMAYLFIIINSANRKYFLLFMSVLLANLSSGIVLSWACIMFFNVKLVLSRYKIMIPISIVLFVGFVGSVSHKIQYMLSERGAEVNGGPIDRSTIVVSFVEGDYARFIIYLLLIATVYFVFQFKLKYAAVSSQLVLFFVPAVINIFFEGIGLISYLFVLIWFVYCLLICPKNLTLSEPKVS
ncbi:hypothetical protein L4D76_13345 [Photobacterium sagamiensis]|uniref:hypothetical protein n=1 Tax=Photobacterium sagamiensis TaxID=2910241 RepID=UPI003D132581